VYKCKQNQWVEEGRFWGNSGFLVISSARASNRWTKRSLARRLFAACAAFFFLLSCMLLKFERASVRSWGPHAQRGRSVWGGVNGTHSVSWRMQIKPWSFVGILWNRVLGMSCVGYTLCCLCFPPLPCHLGRSRGNLLRNFKLLLLRCVLQS
jgi:hypothetical protein